MSLYIHKKKKKKYFSGNEDILILQRIKRLLQGLSSRYLKYSDPSELLRSKQITDFERLESEILVLNYSIFKSEIERLKKASKSYIKWLLSIDPTGNINPEYFKSVLSLLYYSQQDKYSEIQMIFRSARMEMSNTQEKILKSFEGKISDNTQNSIFNTFK